MPSRRSPSGQRQPLTTERIARAALEIVEESGYSAVNMRAVAERLDTGQASLYVHVRGKADLDRVMVESAFAEIDGAPPSGEWREELASNAEWLRRLYARYPGLADAAFASLPRTEAFAHGFETRLERLCAQGFDLRQAQAADLAVALVIAARAIEDAVIAERIAESGLTPDAWWEQAREYMSRDSETRPLTAGLATHLSPAGRAAMTAELLELVLDGIEARYRR